MEFFNFTVAVGAEHPIEYPGSFVRCVVLTGGVSPQIRIKSDQGDQVLLRGGQGFTLGRRFTSLRVKNEEGVGTLTCQLLIGDGHFDDDRISGDVSVLDNAARLLGIVYGTLGQLVQAAVNGVNALVVKVTGGTFADAVTDAGQAFVGAGVQGGSGGNYSHVQLYNPAASGKTIYVDRIEANADGTADFHTPTFYNTALTTSLGVGVNRDSGGAVAAGQIRAQVNGAVLGTAFGNQKANAQVTATYVYEPPLKLGEGEGVAMAAGTPNVAKFATFYWREV